MRVVGLDVGARRIGVAVSDATRTLARPMTVLQIARLDGAAVTRVADEIGRLATEDDGVEAIVVGLPRRLDGRPNDMTAHVQTFAAQLGSRTGLPVSLQDERLTSHEADMRLAERDKDWRSRKKRLDAAAAAIILQDHLDGLAR
jgi:putative holliday junction resolvase